MKNVRYVVDGAHDVLVGFLCILTLTDKAFSVVGNMLGVSIDLEVADIWRIHHYDLLIYHYGVWTMGSVWDDDGKCSGYEISTSQSCSFRNSKDAYCLLTATNKSFSGGFVSTFVIWTTIVKSEVCCCTLLSLDQSFPPMVLEEDIMIPPLQDCGFSSRLR